MSLRRRRRPAPAQSDDHARRLAIARRVCRLSPLALAIAERFLQAYLDA